MRSGISGKVLAQASRIETSLDRVIEHNKESARLRAAEKAIDAALGEPEQDVESNVISPEQSAESAIDPKQSISKSSERTIGNGTMGAAAIQLAYEESDGLPE